MNGTSTVLFEADRTQVIFPFQCVTLRWDVENIWGVYLEEGGVIGQDTRQWCVLSQGTQPTLRVIFPENLPQEYTLTIGIGVFQFGSLVGSLLILVGAIMLFPRPFQRFRRWMGRQKTLTSLLISIWIAVIVFVFWAVSGTPGANQILELAHKIQDFFNTHFTAPYQG